MYEEQVSEMESSAYLENGRLVFEIYVEDYNMAEITDYISNGTIEFKDTKNLNYMEIPDELVSLLDLSYNRIYPGSYPAERIAGTNRIKIIFN